MRRPKLVDCSIWNDWEGVLFPWSVNWVDFTFIHAKVEWDKRFGNAEAHFAILGCHFLICVNFSAGDLEFQAEIQETLDKWNAGAEARKGEGDG